MGVFPMLKHGGCISCAVFLPSTRSLPSQDRAASAWYASNEAAAHVHDLPLLLQFPTFMASGHCSYLTKRRLKRHGNRSRRRRAAARASPAVPTGDGEGWAHGT
jgi:hypothetical protein